MSAVFVELPREAIGAIRDDPFISDVYLDSLALLEDLTHYVVPEDSPARFTADTIEKKLDELTGLARRSGLGEIAENLDRNRESWSRVTARIHSGVNRQEDIARYIHGSRTYRDFAIGTSETIVAPDDPSNPDFEYNRAVIQRSVGRMAAALFPRGLIASEIGWSTGEVEAVESSAGGGLNRAPGFDAEEIFPKFEANGFSAFGYTNSRGITYFLHAKEVTLRGGRRQTIHYFASQIRVNDILDSIPSGFEVKENSHNGFLLLKKI
ncbi:hypothetical protein [Pseudofrankia sp. BMG5.37]|uniref:hypothetical protein n=1 Tax=Pseudofrankia sp. BMG5.37 TaxID=3050035 RepID=UPI0028944148|nr:hypothetical protein [Pseudofrankia sp. BMG5.37]MDT3445822.1 hypothetical protein [Pseudofrankia sp. BMG5.37]